MNRTPISALNRVMYSNGDAAEPPDFRPALGPRLIQSQKATATASATVERKFTASLS